MSRLFPNKARTIVAAAAFAAVLIISIGVFTFCEQKPAPQPQPQPQPVAPQPVAPQPVTPPPLATPPPPVTPPQPAPAQPATGEMTPSTPAPAQPATTSRVYRIYVNEDEPDKYVELSEFKTGCTGLGNIFENDEIEINPKLPEKMKFPLSRMVSITFDKYGLVEKEVPGAGKLFQPAAYRDNTITLKNPDETVQGIIVICRDISGKTADGADWSLDLSGEVAKKFYKIEIVEMP